MEWFLIYLFVSIEKIALLLAIGGSIFWWSSISVLATYALSFIASKDSDSFETNLKKTKRYRVLSMCAASLGALMFVTSALLPDRKELAIIVASGVSYNVITSEPAKQIGSKALQLLQQKLDEALNEGKPAQEVPSHVKSS